MCSVQVVPVLCFVDRRTPTRVLVLMKNRPHQREYWVWEFSSSQRQHQSFAKAPPWIYDSDTCHLKTVTCILYAFVAVTITYFVPYCNPTYLATHHVSYCVNIEFYLVDCLIQPHLFFNSAWLLRTLGYRDSTFVFVLEISFAITFLLFRCIHLPSFVWVVINNKEAGSMGFAKYILFPFVVLQW